MGVDKEIKPREYWVEVLRESGLASNFLARAYRKDQLDLNKEYDPEFDQKKFIHVIEHSAHAALKEDNEALKEYKTHIFEYAHKNLSGDTIGLHIAKALVNEHRDFKDEVLKLRAANDKLRLLLKDSKDTIFGAIKDCGNRGSQRSGIVMIKLIDKALRGADEK